MRWILTIAVCMAWTYVTAQYRPDQKSSTVKFTTKYFGVETGGTVAGLNGFIVWSDGCPLVDCKFDVSVDASTIQTGVELRDNHLRGEDFLDAANHPHIRFVSSKVEPMDGKQTFTVYGELTIKNHTKKISFPFTAEPIDNGYLFKGSFQISRKDFEVGNSTIISDNVSVIMSVLATK